jgi:hypothetical protein
MTVLAKESVQPKASFEIPALDQLLEYENENVLDGFTKSFDISRAEAEHIFKEMLKWLWLSAYSDTFEYQNVELNGIDEPLAILDEMWHTFILYTPDYHEFCRRYFGRYLHHMPTTKEQEIAFREKTRAMPPRDRIEWMKEQKSQKYEEIFDLLGKDTFVTWYILFPQYYSRSRIKKLRKK